MSKFGSIIGLLLFRLDGYKGQQLSNNTFIDEIQSFTGLADYKNSTVNAKPYKFVFEGPIPEIHGMRVERYIDETYFNFVSRLERQKRQLILLFGLDLDSIESIWFSTDHTCAAEKRRHSKSLNASILQIFDRIVTQCELDTQSVDVQQPMQLCVMPSHLTVSSGSQNPEFTQVVIQQAFRHVVPMYLGIALIIACALLSAIFSGLTTGLMALSTDDLILIAEGSDDPKERKYATNILPLRSHGNFLLCSIVLGNIMSNTVMTLLISDLCEAIDDYTLTMLLSLVIPTTIITIFGEVVPQAICSLHGLSIGSHTRYLTIFFMVLFAPISYPISRILDWLVGQESRDVFDRKTLRVLITMQKDLKKEKDKKLLAQRDMLDRETTELVLAAIDLPEKIVISVMTPIEKIFMLSDNSVINKDLLKTIAAKGRTRIPIYSGNDRHSIIAVLNMKDLLPFCQSSNLKVNTVAQLWRRSTQFCFIAGNMPVLQLLIEMKSGIQIAILVTYDERKRDYIVLGLVTLEDLVEEVVGEIMDEKDVKIRRNSMSTRNPWKPQQTTLSAQAMPADNFVQ